MTNINEKEPIITIIDPEEADKMGLFDEEALSDDDAIDSLFDEEEDNE